MSFNRAIYDPCAYRKQLNESTSVLTYVLNPDKFYNCNECRIAFGVVGGNEVSRTKGNLVDLESDLRNQTRLYSHCPGRKFLPNCRTGCKNSKTGLPCGPVSCHKDNLSHLPTCNIVQYKQRPQNVGFHLKYPSCPSGPAPSQTIPHKNHRATQRHHPRAWQGQQGVHQNPY